MFLLRVRGAFVCFLLRLRKGFVCGTAKADFHIHGRIEKNGMGWAWLGLAVNNGQKQRPGSAGVGSGWLGQRDGGEFGRFSRRAWEIK